MARKSREPVEERNLSVRLDAQTKEIVELIAKARKVPEKDIAVAAIQEYCRNHGPEVLRDIEVMKNAISNVIRDMGRAR